MVISQRDGGLCCLCGGEATTTQHRRNRGAGGGKLVNVISNGCAICDRCNFLIEAQSDVAELARRLGVKIRRNASFAPCDVPLRTFRPGRGAVWILPDDFGGFIELTELDALSIMVDLGIVEQVNV